MFRSIRAASLALILPAVLVMGPLPAGAGEGEKDPRAAYRMAADYFGNLEFDKAERWAGVVLGSPKVPEVKDAVLLRALISTVRLQTHEMTGRRYAEAMRKAPIRDEGKRCKDMFLQSIEKSVLAGDLLVTDTEKLLEFVGTPMKVEISKNYDSVEVLKKAYVPYKMLKHGRAPTRREQGDIDRHVSDMSFCFVMSRLIHGPNPESDSIAKEYGKRQEIKGDVNWAGVMTAIGDWLVRYATTCKVGWIHPRTGKMGNDPEKARKGYLVARRCFEKVKELTRDEALGKGRAHAEERIGEIDNILKEKFEKLKPDAEKLPADERGGRD